MQESGLMRDGINQNAIMRISTAISACHSAFDAAAFNKACLHTLSSLTMKQRVQHIILCLYQFLPKDFANSAAIINQCKQHWNYGDANDPLKGFAAWPLIDFIAAYGIDHPHIALPILKNLTSLFSAEFAIRPFLVHHQAITFDYLHTWSLDSDEHVRRLVSEGSRPRLPWGIRLHAFCQDPSAILPLLTQLNNDPSLYVRKSVANSINDIGKDNPAIALTLCQQWKIQDQAHTHWIIRHGLRSLIKSGNADALSILGYDNNIKVALSQFTLSQASITLGDTLEFSFYIRSQHSEAQELIIDYAVYHCRANNKISSKVFKLKTLHLPKKGELQIEKSHSFKAITTRRYYSGMHKIEILINGNVMDSRDFYLAV